MILGVKEQGAPDYAAHTGNLMRMLKVPALSVLLIANCFTFDVKADAVKFDLQHVWHPSENVWGPSCAYGGDEPECRYMEMERNGASKDAIDFTRDWYKRTGDIACLSGFREMGKVDLGEITAPIYNDPDNLDYILVNGSSGIVKLYDKIRNVDIRKGAGFTRLSKKFPNAEVWPGGYSFEAMHRLPDGGQRFVFKFVLLNGCHACDVAGHAKFAYDFDRSGRFVEAKLLGLNRR